MNVRADPLWMPFWEDKHPIHSAFQNTREKSTECTRDCRFNERPLSMQHRILLAIVSRVVAQIDREGRIDKDTVEVEALQYSIATQVV